MFRKERIKIILTKAFEVESLEIVNESHLHSRPSKESHYKVDLTSKDFEGLSRVERQQKVYALLATEFDGGSSDGDGDRLHAISLRLKTPQELKNKPNKLNKLNKNSTNFVSPDCRHKKA